jgi:hypothetical protein
VGEPLRADNLHSIVEAGPGSLIEFSNRLNKNSSKQKYNPPSFISSDLTPPSSATFASPAKLAIRGFSPVAQETERTKPVINSASKVVDPTKKFTGPKKHLILLSRNRFPLPHSSYNAKLHLKTKKKRSALKPR